MSTNSRKKQSISLATFLWLMISVFTLILIFFGIKVTSIHEAIVYSDELQHFQRHPVDVHSFRHLNDIQKETTTTSHEPTHSPTMKPTKGNHIEQIEHIEHIESCKWYPPYDKLRSYDEFDVNFRDLNVDIQSAIKYITKLSHKYCNTFEHGYIYTFHQNQNEETLNINNSLHIAIATVIILPTNKMKNNSMSDKNKNKQTDIFKDIRTYIFRITNALRYAQMHGYSLIILTKTMFNYKYNSNDINDNKLLKNKYEEWMKSPTFQKPFLIKKYLSDFDWILWMDYDTIFLNCDNRAEDIINYAHYTHPQSDDKMSLIFGAERFATINAGVWFIKNSEWSHKLLSDWIFIEENAETFEILKADDVHKDQPLFVALLQGFDVNQDITSSTYKDLRYHNDLAQKKYLEKKLKLDFEDMLEEPIWDEHVAQFAVPIDEAIINTKTQHFNKGKADELDLDISYFYVMHFYWRLKYKTKTVFNAFEYSLHHCF